MEKRGVSHIEVILAFILFMGFVGSAVYFFNPVRNPNVGETFSKSALNEIVKSSSTEVLSYSVKIVYLPPGTDTIAINIADLDSSWKVLAENYKGDVLNAEIRNNLVYVNLQGNDFIVLKFNDGLPMGNVPNSPPLNESFYKIAFVNSEEVVSKARIEEMNGSYYSDADYETLKSSLKIQKERNFAFRLTFDEDYSINAERPNPDNSEVFAYEEKVRVLTKDGRTKFADLNIKTW